MNRRLIMLYNPRTSSGFGQFVRDKYDEKGYEVADINPRAAFWPKVWPAFSCFHFNRNTWWERRWRSGSCSVAAWHRNTRLCEKALKRAYKPGDKILQLQTNYYPSTDCSSLEYYLYIMYPISLSVQVEGMPWKPAADELDEMLRMEKRLIQQARHVFTIADYVTRHVVEQLEVGEEKVSTAGCGGGDFFMHSPPAEIPSAFSNTLLFVGWDFELKGGRDLLEGFRIARERLPQLRLQVAGPDPAAVGAHPGVVALGPIRDRNRLLQLYRGADLFVMPSVFDSFGYVFIEAMSQYVPCIGTDYNAMPEIIEHGKTGYIVPLRDPQALADAICRYYEREENRREMGADARQRAVERFQWGSVVDRMIQGMWG